MYYIFIARIIDQFIQLNEGGFIIIRNNLFKL